jgi:putative glycosyltransferase (TIGR04348 family)
MRILIVTPAKPGSRHGNRNTAVRWARHLRKAGHTAEIVVDVDESKQAHDLMIALHARRSAAAIELWKSKPGRPLILALTGTDLYRDIRTDASAQRSMQLADAMIVLQAEGLNELVPTLRAKTRVIHQSVRAVQRQTPPSTYCLVTVIGHLRDEKDPLRAAFALRHVPPELPVRVVQLGAAMEDALGDEARAMMQAEVEAAGGAVARARYRWLGELPHGDAMRWLARSHAMVISSRMEGGAHVVSEAIACGVAVIASDIPGNVGLLGRNYRGYYPLGDERALAALLERLVRDRRFMLTLQGDVIKRRHLVDAGAERDALRAT